MDIKTVLNIMGHWNLTADEALLIWLTLAARDEEGHPEYFNQWYNGGGKERLKDLFQSLKDKGFIHKNYDPDGYNPNDIEFNASMIKAWWKYSNALGQEFLSAYPSFANINGRLCPLKDITKSKCTSLDEFFFFYSSQIGHNVQRHKEIIDLIQWGKQNNYPFGNVAAFVASNGWTLIKELRDNPNLDNTVVNICKDE